MEITLERLEAWAKEWLQLLANAAIKYVMDHLRTYASMLAKKLLGAENHVSSYLSGPIVVTGPAATASN